MKSVKLKSFANLNKRTGKVYASLSDDVDKLFIALIGLIAVMVLISTFDELYLSTKNCATVIPSRELLNIIKFHYKSISFPTALREFLKSFSFVSNFKSFFNEHEAQDLDFIHSIKFLTMLFVIMGHCILLHSVLPFNNPEFIEAVSFMNVTSTCNVIDYIFFL